MNINLVNEEIDRDLNVVMAVPGMVSRRCELRRGGARPASS